MEYMQKLLDIMKELRHRERGCPWDIQQDFGTIAPCTVEEAYEVADAIARENMDDLRDELGDLLFQVVFHAQMASEAGDFDFADVVTGIVEKMVRRHPHVFGNTDERAAGVVEGSWETIKARERVFADDSSALAGIATALPALKRAQKLGNRASRVGFDWSDRQGVSSKIQEELDEVEQAIDAGESGRIEEELGDVLFSVVNMARHLSIDPEKALSGANRKFERRFRDMEREIGQSSECLQDCDLESLEKHWRAAKTRVG